MGKCPVCKREINYLEHYGVVHMYRVKVDADDFEADLDYEPTLHKEWIAEWFVCPKCKNVVAKTEDEAINILLR